MCCLLPLFFVPPVNGVPASLQWLRGGAAGAGGGGEEEDWRWSAEDAASTSLYFLLLPPAFCLCFVHSPLSFSLRFSFFSLFSSVPLSVFFSFLPTLVF